MLLIVNKLNIEFWDHSLPETVVNQVSFSVDEGEMVGIVGESGSGKSMTALAIAGLLNRKDMEKDGEILYKGKDLLKCPRKELRTLQGSDIGMVFQEPMTSLNPVKKIGWQVEESLRVHTKLSKEEMKQKALEAMREAELEDAQEIYEKYPHELSGGMRQRIMIASAMISQPALLIADEPTTALDVTIQMQIIELLKKINHCKKTAILFISHDLSLVKQLCSRVLVMKDGCLVEEGSVEQIFQSPKEEYTKQLISAIPKVER